jgi:hypothetical protein
MKVLWLAMLLPLSGCCSSGSDAKWNDMLVDIALRHKYERYNCPCHCHSTHHEKVKPHRIKLAQPKQIPPPAVDPIVVKQEPANLRETQHIEETIDNLTGRLEALEKAMTDNASTTTANQKMLVDQINELKRELIQRQQQETVPTLGTLGIPGN